MDSGQGRANRGKFYWVRKGRVHQHGSRVKVKKGKRLLITTLTPLLKQEWCRKLKPLAGARQPRQHRHTNFCDPGTSVPSLISRHDATVRYTYCGIQLPWKHQLIWTLKHGSQEWLRPRAFCLVYKTLASRCKRAFCISGLILTQKGTNLRRK